MADQMRPREEILGALYDDLHAHLFSVIKTKINDSNTSKASDSTGHRRNLSIPAVHKLIYRTGIVAKCLVAERVDLSFNLSFSTIDRVQTVLGTPSLARFQRNKDTTIIAPWMLAVKDFTVKVNKMNEYTVSTSHKGEGMFFLKQIF